MVIETELWEEVIGHPDYEICVEDPHEIRSKKTGKIVSELINNKGYFRLTLDGKKYLKHRLVDDQFIPNDDPTLKDQVDHINRDTMDNRVSNLRWTTASENNYNRSRNDAIFVDELPYDFIEVDHYGKHECLVGLYYYDGTFYLDTGVN